LGKTSSVEIGRTIDTEELRAQVEEGQRAVDELKKIDGRPR
jgi:hypothetical protein